VGASRYAALVDARNGSRLVANTGPSGHRPDRGDQLAGRTAVASAQARTTRSS